MAGIKKTYYLDTTTVELLNDIKINHNLKSMNDVFVYLLNKETDSNTNTCSFDNKKLHEIDKNIEILLEIIPVMADKQNVAPLLSYKHGVANAYNEAKKLVDERIENNLKAKKENEFFN